MVQGDETHTKSFLIKVCQVNNPLLSSLIKTNFNFEPMCFPCEIEVVSQETFKLKNLNIQT